MHPLLGLCIPDIFEQIAEYLSAPDILSIATTDRQLSKFIQLTGVLYRHITLPYEYPTQQDKLSNTECLAKLVPCLQRLPSNAWRISSLTIRHKFSGWPGVEEVEYIEQLATLCELCPNLLSLSLHLSNFFSCYYATGPMKDIFPLGASRVLACAMFEPDSVLKGHFEKILDSVSNLRSLDWCLTCRPSGVLSDDWKLSKLREELEIINGACPNLEHLGLLDFVDANISSAIIYPQLKTESFLLKQENILTGIFPNLSDITFHMSEDRHLQRFVSALVVGVRLRLRRGLRVHIVPWCHKDASQKVVVENVNDIRDVYNFLGPQFGISHEEFRSVWGEIIHCDIVNEIAISRYDTSQLSLLRSLASHARSLNISLNMTGSEVPDAQSLKLPPQTKQLSIKTSWCPISTIAQFIYPLKIQQLKIEFELTIFDVIDGTVTMTLNRHHSFQQFTVEWRTEPLTGLSIAMMGSGGISDNLLSTVIKRAIGKGAWESRTHLGDAIKSLLEGHKTLERVEIIAAYPLFKEELASPRLFKV